MYTHPSQDVIQLVRFSVSAKKSTFHKQIVHSTLCECISASKSSKQCHNGRESKAMTVPVLVVRVLTHLPLCVIILCSRKLSPPSLMLPENIFLITNPRLNTTALDCIPKHGVDWGAIWIQWIGDGNWRTVSLLQLWRKKLLCQKGSHRRSTETVKLVAKHVMAAENTAQHAHPLVGRAKAKTARIHKTENWRRKSVTVIV